MAGQAPPSPPPIGYNALDAAAAAAAADDDDDAAAAKQDPSVMAGQALSSPQPFRLNVLASVAAAALNVDNATAAAAAAAEQDPSPPTGLAALANLAAAALASDDEHAAAAAAAARPSVMDNADAFRSLCNVLGINVKQKIIDEVDSSIGDINEWMSKCQDLNEATATRLSNAVERLSQIKLERFDQVKRMGSCIMSYWADLSTPSDEKQSLVSLPYYVDLASADKLKIPNALSLSFTNIVENEFNRLAQQLDHLVVRKRKKLNNMLRMAHLQNIFPDTGVTEKRAILQELKARILYVRELSASRSDVVLRAEQLESAVVEIQWYLAFIRGGNSGQQERVNRGEVLVEQFLQMLEGLKERVDAWVIKNGESFMYDGSDINALIDRLGEQYEHELYDIDIPFSLNIPRRARTLRPQPQPQVPAEPAPDPKQEELDAPEDPHALCSDEEEPDAPEDPHALCYDEEELDTPEDPHALCSDDDDEDDAFMSDPNDPDFIP
ncbi:hypothetical protein ACP70R_035749 [Stipagrostis hirtigluma subsp. patula]